jgi:hypothetical protein
LLLTRHAQLAALFQVESADYPGEQIELLRGCLRFPSAGFEPAAHLQGFLEHVQDGFFAGDQDPQRAAEGGRAYPYPHEAAYPLRELQKEKAGQGRAPGKKTKKPPAASDPPLTAYLDQKPVFQINLPATKTGKPNLKFKGR